MRRCTRPAVPILVGLLLAGCSASSPTPAASLGASAQPPPASEVATASPPPSEPDQVTPSIGPYNLPEGSWSDGMVHVEVAGDAAVVLDLPFVSGETSSGRTTFMFENYDETLEEYSIGAVTISLLLENDSIYVDAGDLKVLSGCDYTFGHAAERDLAADIVCDEDVQASLGGSPVEVSVTGSFTGS